MPFQGNDDGKYATDLQIAVITAWIDANCSVLTNSQPLELLPRPRPWVGVSLHTPDSIQISTETHAIYICSTPYRGECLSHPFDRIDTDPRIPFIRWTPPNLQPTEQPALRDAHPSNWRTRATDRNDRLRNRTESYILGVANGPDATGFRAAFDPFSLACYRALLLGSPGVIIGATIQPGKRNLLTEPLLPQRLAGEETVEPKREWSNRIAHFFIMRTDREETGDRRFFGCRQSDTTCEQWATWLQYRPQEVILDQATGEPPTYTDMADFAQKAATLAWGKAPTKAQVWSTWFWLLLHATFCAAKCPAAADASPGSPLILPWIRNEFGITFYRHSVIKKGR